MSFRQASNQHDAWVAFHVEHAASFESIGLVGDALLNEQRFLDFLTRGSLPDSALKISSMSDDTFLLLEKLVNEWLFDGWAQQNCSVFHRERLRRFGRYG